MGRKSNYQLAMEKMAATQRHYLQYKTLRTFIDISQSELDEIAFQGHITKFRPKDRNIVFWCLEEVSDYLLRPVNMKHES